MSKGSMRILRKNLPDAPPPTRPKRIDKQEHTFAQSIDANPIEIFVSDRDSAPSAKKQAARERGLATIDKARAASIENARKRAYTILEL